MTAPAYDRPAPGEFSEFYAAYIASVPDGDLLATLEHQGAEVQHLLGNVPAAKGDFAYAPGKWTLKDVILHVADAERVFAYRALRIARGDEVNLHAFDENAWVPRAGAGRRSLKDLLAELAVVRSATVALLRHLPPDAPTRRGLASGKEITVRALAWITAGHERHHLRIIRDRYLA